MSTTGIYTYCHTLSLHDARPICLDVARQPHHLDGAGAVGQAADEAALFKPGDEPVNARLGLEGEGVLHLVERGRDAVFLKVPVDEEQKLVLLFGEHGSPGPPVCRPSARQRPQNRSEEHTSELQSLMRISYAVFCLKKKTTTQAHTTST